MNLLSSLFEGEIASVAWATIGGIAVAVGLVIEKVAEFFNERFLGGYKAHKRLELAGWWILMLGIWIEVADAGWTALEIRQAKEIASASDIHHKPIFAFSAYAYVVVRPSERKEDLNNTNLVSFGWAENAALFPFKPIGEGNGGTAWLSVGVASEIANGWSGREASVGSDCVLETIAEVGDEKMLRFDMYFGIHPDDNALPPSNRSFQNTKLTPDEVDAINLSLPIQGEIMGGEVQLNIDNGQIQRAFKIPKQIPLGNSATSVATNGTFIAIDWNPQLRTNFAKYESIRLKKIADGDAFVKKGKELEEASNGDTNKGRTISDEQAELFIGLLKDYPKIPIKVFVNPEDVESVKYAGKIRHLLDSAGYGGGLMPVTGDLYVTTNSVKVSPPPHTLVYFALPEKKFGWVIPISTPFDGIKPVISSGLTNDPGVFAIGSLDCVKWAFSGIGLNGFYTSSANLLQYGEVGIFVPRKAQ